MTKQVNVKILIDDEGDDSSNLDMLESIEYRIKEILPDSKLIFKHYVISFDRLIDYKGFFQAGADVYVLDVGGLTLGLSNWSYVKSIIRLLPRLIEDLPSAVFLLWSRFTENIYFDEVNDEFPELVEAPNVLNAADRYKLADEDNWAYKLRCMFGFPTIEKSGH